MLTITLIELRPICYVGWPLAVLEKQACERMAQVMEAYPPKLRRRE
jgi:hypothetical protein